MKISLIVPTYNRVDNTRALIDRIIESHQDELYEIIFTDDGSTEDQAAALLEFSDRLRIPCALVSQEDRGFRLARARNNGVRYSSGDYLCFLDQDLIPSPGYFQAVKRFARRGRFLLTRTLYADSGEKEEILSDPDDAPLMKVYRKGRGYLRKVALKDYFYYLGKRAGIGDRRPKLKGGAFSLFRDKFELVNGFDENFIGWGLEDDDLGRRLYLAGVKGFNISHRAWTCHLWHEPVSSKLDKPNQERYNTKRYSPDNIQTSIGLRQDQGETLKIVVIS